MNENSPLILVIDDMPEMLSLLVDLLEEEGYRVRAVDNGTEALSVAIAEPPDLVLLDVRLKDMNGLEVCRRFKDREETRNIPIILLSGYAEMDEWIEGLDIGAVDYVSKPFVNRELVARVKTHIALRRATLSLEKQTALLSQTNERLQDEIAERRSVEQYFRKHLDQARHSRLALLSAMEDLKRAEEEQETLHAQLIQAQKMEAVGRLAGGVAHDFNNMLGVILGHAEMALEQTNPEEPSHGNITEIITAAQRSTEITRQLLGFARKQVIVPKVLDLNETIENTLKMLRRLIGEDIDLVWTPKANLWPVKADPSQIDQILANLCVNARDAIGGVGKIFIETDKIVLDECYRIDHPGATPGEFVMLAVSDDGCGMNKEIRNNIFEPFFTTKGLGEGTGLGLATVYGIVKQNNGYINVYSEPGQGATFRIYLPRHGEPVAEELRPEDTEIPPGKGETLLIVEDEASILRLAKKMLEGLGYKVLTSETPDRAMEIVASHAGVIHLLMTDVVMPGMNGRDLAERLQQSRPDLKIMFMSGYTADVIARRGILDEGVHFIQKPFNKRGLAGKVREALMK